jgi:hypothetical protein
LRCDSVLNSPDKVKGSMPDLKSVANNPDAALTAIARAGLEGTCRLCAEHAGEHSMPYAERRAASPPRS